MNKLCPCGSGHSYDEYCGLIISAKKTRQLVWS
ncbi:MAG: SEC-C domain-containing protein [Prolixibacteraceae bacterium]|nr:SEC-C domain-containing protein [Prolixibacteraceae bacterium]